MRNLHIGVIGAGRIAQAAHLPALARATGAELVAICDPSDMLVREVARRYAVPGYSSATELLANERVEAVIVAAPDRLHLPLAAEALLAGKHVLVEKPLAGTLEDGEKLATMVQETGLYLQVGAMKRYDPGVQFAAAAVGERIGRVLSASIWYRVMSALRPPTEATLFPALVIDHDVRAHEAGYKADRAAYLLTTHGAHVFDGLRYLLGQPTDLSARFARTETDFSWHGLASLENGGLVHFEITADIHAPWSEGADIYGEKGYVKLRTRFPFTLLASEVEVFDEATATGEYKAFPDSNPYERQIESFAEAIRDGRPVSPSAEDGLAAMRMIDAVGSSVAAGGQYVEL